MIAQTELELESAVRRNNEYLSTPRFEGSDYNHERDSARLTGQKERIFKVVKDGQWRTTSEIAKLAKAPENSVSSQLRQLRKPEFGSHTLNKRYLGEGLYVYQVIVNEG